MKFKVGDTVGCDKHHFQMGISKLKKKYAVCDYLDSKGILHTEIHRTKTLYKIILTIEEREKILKMSI